MAPNPNMLRLARQRLGYQQTEAAKLLGLDQSFLSRIENGLVEIRDDVIQKAAMAYDLPITFFSLQDTVYGAPVSVHPMWRKKADVTAREMDSVIAELNIRVMHLRRFFEGVVVNNTSDMPIMDIEGFGSPEKIAALARAHWRTPAGPIRNLTQLAEKAGAVIIESPMNGASISGVRFSVPGMPALIVLNSAQPADRMRFTLAHELGHMIMHRFPTPNMEQEANEFAVALLMPAEDIRPYFIGRRIDLALLAALKPEWRVSIAALLMRSHKLNFITDNQHTYLWKQISARGYSLREPPELDFEHEKPELINRIVRLHFEALKYTPGDLAQLLCLHEREFQAMYPVGGDEAPKRARLSILK